MSASPAMAYTASPSARCSDESESLREKAALLQGAELKAGQIHMHLMLLVIFRPQFSVR